MCDGALLHQIGVSLTDWRQILASVRGDGIFGVIPIVKHDTDEIVIWPAVPIDNTGEVPVDDDLGTLCASSLGLLGGGNGCSKDGDDDGDADGHGKNFEALLLGDG